MTRKQSDLPDSKKPKKVRPTLPKPRPFHMTEPFQDRGLWCFWLTADPAVMEYIGQLPCVLQPSFGSPFQRRPRGRLLFSINPRYDHEETWLWILDLLETEAINVALDQSWEDAIEKAVQRTDKSSS